MEWLGTDQRSLQRAAQLLRAGELVAFPTETVYGLGADGLNPVGVAKIYEAKGRPSDNPLILHFAHVDQVEDCADFTPLGRILAQRFWPGPLTLVMNAKPLVPLSTRGGLDTVACRCPDHPIARELIGLTQRPLAAPSANRSGRPSPTNAQMVASDMDGRIAALVDGGSCQWGVESTVLDVRGNQPLVLRFGGVTVEQLEQVCGSVLFPTDVDQCRHSPGTRYRHYAPTVPVWVWFPDQPFPQGQVCYVGVLPPPDSVTHSVVFQDEECYTAGFYHSLQTLEKFELPIVVQWPGESGLCRALADRIRRSAGL